jgi:hypothetical protein
MTVASPKMIKTPGAGSPDPFNALPIACTRRVHILMHHCKLINPGRNEIFWFSAHREVILSLSSCSSPSAYGNSCISLQTFPSLFDREAR